jgi:hypothetical protein
VGADRLRYHGVFAPNSEHRALVTPSRRGKGNKRHHANEADDHTPIKRRAPMSRAQRLKRVFNIDIETCTQCGGPVKVLASIEDPAVIQNWIQFSGLVLGQKGGLYSLYSTRTGV